MESVAYQAKRAHWGITWFAIRQFKAAAIAEGKPELTHMTPARFDILFLIEERYPWAKRGPGLQPPIHMSELVDRLGLAPSTISKTVKAMVKHGLVVKNDDPVDGRRVLVTLTEVGALAYRAALKMLRVDDFLYEKLARVLTTLYEPGHSEDLTVDQHRANGLRLEHERLRALARKFEYWADDIYEPGFDAMVRSPLQSYFDAARQRRSQRSKGKRASTNAIPLWEGWGAPRPCRHAPAALARD